jgi:hypothetical protein
LFDDIRSNKISPPDLPPPGHPRIGLVTGGNANFATTEGNKWMMPKDDFLRPLSILNSAIDSGFEPDFTVLQMSPATLHRSSIGTFTGAILQILERGQSVNICLRSLQTCGLPQDRKVLTVISSKFPGLNWELCRADGAFVTDTVAVQSANRVKDVIQSLEFSNTRKAPGGFICSDQNSSGEVPESNPRYIYNHVTSRRKANDSPMVVDMDTAAIAISGTSPFSLIHQGKQRIIIP